MAAILSLLSVAQQAAADIAPGPRLAVVRDGEPLPGEELINTDPAGEHWFTIKRTPNASGAFQSFAWSPDGTKLAVGGFPGLPGQRVFALRSDGGSWRPVPGTRGGFAPTFSPDGTTIAFARLRFRERPESRGSYASIAIWKVGLNGGKARQLTPWKNGLAIEPGSFSPDGRNIVAVRYGNVPEIVSVPVGAGATKVLVRDGLEPRYSPNGTGIAFVRRKVLARDAGRPPVEILGGDLYVAAADGSAVRRLTFNPARREESPSWDPSGERLAYAQYPAKRTFLASAGVGSSIFEINRDGTCRHRLLFTYGLSYMHPAWQPGPGREAGRIAC